MHCLFLVSLYINWTRSTSIWLAISIIYLFTQSGVQRAIAIWVPWRVLYGEAGIAYYYLTHWLTCNNAAHLFSFLCCVVLKCLLFFVRLFFSFLFATFCFVLFLALSCDLCTQYYQSIWIFHYWLSLRACFSLNKRKRISKGQSQMENPETLTTWSMQYEEIQGKTQHNMCWTPLCANKHN